jgi:hypothetical protein
MSKPEMISISFNVTKSFVKEKLKFDLDSEENTNVLNDLKVFPDGSIIACKRDRLIKYIDDKDFQLEMMGARKITNREIKNIESEDDFWYILARCTDPEDY